MKLKKRMPQGILLVLSSLLFTSCSGAASGEGILSPEEMESTHLEMELSENVVIDASMTPCSRYQNGLNSYYVSVWPQESDLVAGETFLAEPSVYGYSLEELAQLLAEQSGFSAEYTCEMVSNPGHLYANLVMSDSSGAERTLQCAWNIIAEEQVDPAPAALYYNYDWSSYDHNVVCNLLRSAVPDETELNFADSGVLATHVEKFLEMLTGEDYYPEVICVPMGEANRQMMRDYGYVFEESSPSLYLDEDFYGFLFYRDMDGFPLQYLCPSIPMDENTVLDEELERQLYNGNLIPLVADKQFVSWGERGGLRYLSTDKKLCTLGTYKEQAPVCDINTVLEYTKQYFDSVLIVDPITVNRIEIAYSYWFSDAEDGPVRNIAAPFWTVQYRNPATEAQIQLIFDAFSGQFIAEKPYMP